MAKINKILSLQFEKKLIDILVSLDSKKKAIGFFRDFFSKKEQMLLIKRLAGLYYIKKGREDGLISQNLKIKREEILDLKNKITRDGIVKAIKEIESEEWANKWAKAIKGNKKQRMVK